MEFSGPSTSTRPRELDDLYPVLLLLPHRFQTLCTDSVTACILWAWRCGPSMTSARRHEVTSNDSFNGSPHSVPTAAETPAYRHMLCDMCSSSEVLLHNRKFALSSACLENN